MAEAGFSVLILAGGKATRFKSERPKLLHPLAGRLLGEYILRTAAAASPERVYMIVGYQAAEMRKAFARPGLEFIVQAEQMGTGHALMVSRPELERCPSDVVVVLVGDAPLLKPETLSALVSTHRKEHAACTILTTRLDEPAGYGRIVRSGKRVRAIVEERVANPAQKKIHEINTGILCFSRLPLLEHLGELSRRNAQNEYLLTDLVGIFNRHGLKVAAFEAPAAETVGINDREQLAEVEKTLRLCKAVTLMKAGVTITNPEATYIDADVEIGADTILEPGVSLRGGTRVGRGCRLEPYSTITDSRLADGVTVRPCSVITGCEVGAGATIGPFAHLRDGAEIGPGARLGNFVEVKKSKIGKGAKALHLTYLGDASVGAHSNIGAGTVTCNYDGEKKHPTTIEEGVFIGSGNMLVAPVRIGKDSFTAAGSTITEDVPPESLAIGRARQVTKEGWARERKKTPPARDSAEKKP
jgi:bifunctional UDP-N-acetylglucosamine pyrophosphorylase/glucosamine-1-phosphate N-acetyltransferase